MGKLMTIIEETEDQMIKGNPVVNYTCKSCNNEWFHNLQDLKIHFYGHHYCYPCQESFEVAYNQQKHIENQHQMAARCPYCCFSTRYGDDLTKHVVTQHGQKAISVVCRWSKLNGFADVGDSGAMQAELMKHFKEVALEFVQKRGLPLNYPVKFDVELRLNNEENKRRVETLITHTNAHVQLIGQVKNTNNWKRTVRKNPKSKRFALKKDFKHLQDETFTDIMKCNNKCVYYCRYCNWYY